MKAMHRALVAAAAAVAAAFAPPGSALASGHREAPLAALDRAADVTDVYAFRAYDGSATPALAIVVSFDAFAEGAGGPLGHPFDPDVRYEIDVDNDNDAVADVRFVFRFQTESLPPDRFQAYLGVGTGAVAPGNSPPPVAPGAQVVPPRIATFSAAGLALRQTYTVNMLANGVATPLTNGDGSPFRALPSHVGPRTMDHGALRSAAVYTLANGIRVFAGATDDGYAADAGALFDTFNARSAIAPGVLSPAQDAALVNLTSDAHSGFAVNSIAVQVPVTMLTRTGAVEPATSTAATVGVWATTFRRRRMRREPAHVPAATGPFVRVQRMGNPLVNQLLIPLASRDRFATTTPNRDSRYEDFLLDPFPARLLNALSAGAIPIPTPPRNDLLPLFLYAPPIAAAGTPAGPLADLLRVNTGVPPTPLASASRLGLLGGDPAGFPNGRRPVDDVTDVMLRLLAGTLAPGFNAFPNNRLGDGVNVNDAPLPTTFPYLASAPSGRDRRHVDPAEAGCTAGGGAACAP